MILVVADTGSVRYLVLAGAIGILSKLFDRVILPSAVLAELTHVSAPPEVREWALRLPAHALADNHRLKTSLSSAVTAATPPGSWSNSSFTTRTVFAISFAGSLRSRRYFL